ncbi:hypothetical protein FisN_6Lh416 [Fistulifera solaris]|uniref:Uncharacterized protein n=1 Tax=Fistulifera solaris TaxID=1519565 RepID=A0A1Z5JLI4_FISSO|nr:hypothetical protein FisN_6Lh416 [Fistulifera solaris]|eukprot:GAX14631.1 hypothetical protein FisN_6Lh416 [Fistulifera solaris]
MTKKTDLWTFPSIFGLEKCTYRYIAAEFHPFHQHEGNVCAHLFTTSLGVWGAIQLARVLGFALLPVAYGILVAATTPLMTAFLHSLFLYGAFRTSVPLVFGMTSEWQVCLLAIAAGYGLQDVAHWVFQEKTYMQSYMGEKKPWMLIVHSIWLLPLVLDSMTMRYWFLPKIVSRNRIIVTQVASREAVENLRKWIHENVPETPETTHVWPHKQDATSQATAALEHDPAILEGFRRVFAAKHFDVCPVQSMNEIYVTAVGAKKEINSDAVFYTPHTDGPYWFLPGASLYRVLVGVTPNRMVRTRFNLQHESRDKVVDMYDVLGFDYSRELHWIDHVPGAVNDERRSLLKLHFIVYPKGWHWYGDLCASLQTNYNTWARNNFLRTLRPEGWYEFGLAWWIWLTTWTNAIFEEHVGWSNLVYLLASYAMGATPFLILTSFRHYVVYITTFAFREPDVGHGYLMRDAKLYKTVSMMHIARRILPLVAMQNDWPAVLLAFAGFGTTLAATARLGMVRTYFGTELGLVKPMWISGFPYGYIPHPMIVGQIFAFYVILGWFWPRLTQEDIALLVTHMGFYTAHMLQEMFTGSY